jgi:sarcosine oxidase
MNNHYDTIVLGLGAMGSAATYQLAKRGNKVLGIDQFSPPHMYGSSHGDTRITRQAIGEGEQYTPLVLRSNEIWEELENVTGKRLYEKCGGLIISSGAKTAINHVENFFENTLAAAQKFNIPHEILDAAAIRSRFPQFSIQDNEHGYFEPGAGFLRPEECLSTQLELAKQLGADLHLNEKVLGFTEGNEGVMVETDKGVHHARKLIISAGPWAPTLLGDEYSKHFKVIRQVLYWFDIKESVDLYLKERFPVFIWELQGNTQGIYGFPALGGQRGGLKIATEQYGIETTADEMVREVSAEETRMMYENFVQPYFPGLGEVCTKAVSCLYTVTTDSHFVIDVHPQYPSVIVASPCSGHGFKHSAAIGEALSQLVIDGVSEIDIGSFGFGRFTK